MITDPQLVGGRAKACEVYPRRLGEAMLRGHKDQLAADGHKNSDGSLLMTGHDEDRDHDWETYYDDLSNLPLRSDLVDKARQEEMEVFAKFPMYTKVPLQDATISSARVPLGPSGLMSTNTTRQTQKLAAGWWQRR